MSDIANIHREQGAWCEGWRKTPFWLRLLGAPRSHYEDRGSYRMRWGELSLKPAGLALKIGAHDNAHLNIALILFQVFIRLPFLDKALTTGTNSIEHPAYGFSTYGWSIHLNWGRRTKIIGGFWQRRGHSREFYSAFGTWLPHDRLWREYEPTGVKPYAEEHPYHYMLDNGEVQHVTATVTRERSWMVWSWFGESTQPRALAQLENGRLPSGRKPRKAWISDFLRSIQKRLGRPRDYIEISFSGEVGSRAGSWKGGTIGCSYQMKPGETPRHTLMRMQRERRFR